MTLRLSLIVAAALVPLLAGCQQRRIAARQMQEELRFQEDRIYQLEDWIRQYATQLNDCRKENLALRGGKVSAPAPKKPLRVSPFGEDEPKVPDVPEVEIPQVEIPKIDTPPVELPVPNRGAQRSPARTGTRQVRLAAAGSNERPASRQQKPATQPAPVRRGAPPAAAPRGQRAVVPAIAVAAATPENKPQNEPGQVKLSAYEAADPEDSAIAGITLSRLLTAPLNTDGIPGDDGLLVVVEPRNRAGQLVPPAGELSVVVIDRAAATEAEARIGRWDFSREETARLYRRTTLGDGIQLKLFWHDRQPGHSPLELHARLTTPDGRKLEASRAMEVALTEAAAAQAAQEPARLQPEPDVAQPIAPQPVPAAAVKAPAIPVDANLFEIVPIPGPKPAAQPVPLPLPVRPQPMLAPSVEPRVAALPAPPPRKSRPAPPPAEEQVEIPTEPGSEPQPTTQPAAEPTPPAKPAWAPYRKQK